MTQHFQHKKHERSHSVRTNKTVKQQVFPNLSKPNKNIEFQKIFSLFRMSNIFQTTLRQIPLEKKSVDLWKFLNKDSRIIES